jgi:hypothetical protein
LNSNSGSIAPITKSSNKKSVGVEAELCAGLKVTKGSCWKCYRLFDTKFALTLEPVLENGNPEANSGAAPKKNWIQSKKPKIFCSQNCLDDEVKRTCRVCLKCGRTFLRSEGKGIYCGERCSPRPEEMAIEMNNLIKSESDYDKVLKIIESEDLLMMSQKNGLKSGILRGSVMENRSCLSSSSKSKKSVSFHPFTKENVIGDRKKIYVNEMYNPEIVSKELRASDSGEGQTVQTPENLLSNSEENPAPSPHAETPNFS